WRLLTHGMTPEEARRRAEIGGDTALLEPFFHTIAVMASAVSAARRSRSSLPREFLGRASTNTMLLGTLCSASRSRQWRVTASLGQGLGRETVGARRGRWR